MKALFNLTTICLSGLFMLSLTFPALAAEYEDEEAGFRIEYDDEAWTIEDNENFFTEEDYRIGNFVGEPLVLLSNSDELAVIMVLVSENKKFKGDVLKLVESTMGELKLNSIIEKKDTFTDSEGNEFKSTIRCWGVTPEYEDEAILLSQLFFNDDIRYEICFIAMPEIFPELYDEAIEMLNSIEIL